MDENSLVLSYRKKGGNFTATYDAGISAGIPFGGPGGLLTWKTSAGMPASSSDEQLGSLSHLLIV